jgi:hypothetical protein
MPVLDMPESPTSRGELKNLAARLVDELLSV